MKLIKTNSWKEDKKVKEMLVKLSWITLLMGLGNLGLGIATRNTNGLLIILNFILVMLPIKIIISWKEYEKEMKMLERENNGN